MSIPLTGAGGLFTRLGHQIYALTNIVNTYQGTTLPTRTGVIQADYASTDQDLIDNLYSQLQSGPAGGYRVCAEHAAVKRRRRVHSDGRSAMLFSLPHETISRRSPYLVNTYLPANSQTVAQNVVGSSTSAGGSNTGNGIVIVGLTSNLGVPLEYSFAEQISAICTRDAQSGGAVAGQESFQFTGQAAVNSTLNWLFPGGSGANTTLICVNALANGGRGTANQLQNGSFETWTTLANVPNNWHVGTGTPGTTILESTAQHYDGIASLEFAGNGTENTSVQTQFGVDFATSTGAAPLAQYCVNLTWLQNVGHTGRHGVLSVEAFVDGSGTQLLDNAGNASAFTVALTGVPTTWAPYSAVLCVRRRVLPTQV